MSAYKTLSDKAISILMNPYVESCNSQTNRLSIKEDRLLVDGNDVGLAEIFYPTRAVRGGNGIEIGRLYIDPVFQKQGIGGLLIDKLFKDNSLEDFIDIYPSGKSEAFWLRQGSDDMDTEGYFRITRESRAKRDNPTRLLKPNKTYSIEGAVRHFRSIESQHWNDDGAPKAGAMLAPNGSPTNLNKEQWILVRTEVFKTWFGDWLNDPKNASKIVDANCEPLVVYHGTPDGSFTEFELNVKSTSGQSEAKHAHWFTDDIRVANRFSEIQLYERAAPELSQQAFDIKWKNRFGEILAKIKDTYDNELSMSLKYEFEHIQTIVFFYGKRNLKELMPELMPELISDYEKLKTNELVEIDSPNRKVFAVFLDMKRPAVHNGSDVGVGLSRLFSDGHEEDPDGSVIKNADTGQGIANEYAVFESNQILFADRETIGQRIDMDDEYELTAGPSL